MLEFTCLDQEVKLREHPATSTPVTFVPVGSSRINDQKNNPTALLSG
jgi:hypothetical protein